MKTKNTKNTGLREEKSKLVKIISELKCSINSSELKDINHLYDKYFSIQKADIIRLESYKSFLQSYIAAKYNHDYRGKK